MQIHYLNAISAPVKSWHDGSRMLRQQQEDGRSFCCPREDEGCGKPAQEEAAGIYGINPGCVAELLLWALVMAWLPEQEGKLAGSTGHTWLCPPAWSHPHARSRREKCVIIVINIRNIYCKYSAESDLFTPDTQRCECSAQGCCHVSLPEGCTVLLRVCQGCVGPLSPALVKSRWAVSKAVLTEVLTVLCWVSFGLREVFARWDSLDWVVKKNKQKTKGAFHWIVPLKEQLQVSQLYILRHPFFKKCKQQVWSIHSL